MVRFSLIGAIIRSVVSPNHSSTASFESTWATTIAFRPTRTPRLDEVRWDVAFPIIDRGEPLGVLCVAYFDEAMFSRDEDHPFKRSVKSSRPGLGAIRFLDPAGVEAVAPGFVKIVYGRDGENSSNWPELSCGEVSTCSDATCISPS